MKKTHPGRLDHVTYGDPSRPALTLLHAGGLTHREWETLGPRLAERFFVIAPTALGHGSSPPADTLSFADLARAVLDLLDDLGIERSHFLGSSMGGATALYIVTRCPERVDRLVLYRTNFRTGPGGSRALDAMTRPETWRQWGLEKQMREQHLPQGGPDAWIEVAKKVIAMVRSEKTGELAQPEDLERITAPTLIVCGDRDPLVPLSDAILMHEKIPSSALWVVPDATHVIQIESLRRDSFPTEVLAFLRGMTVSSAENG